MKKEGYWVIRTYKAGRIGEKIKYWVPGKRPSRSLRRIKSDIKKQQQNESDAIKHVARLINENFLGGDAFDALTYSDDALDKLVGKLPPIKDPEERMAALYKLAEHELELYIRRCRNACKKAGIEFKYIAITSDMDGETGERVRIHHHIIANREVRGIIRELWLHGTIEKDAVWHEDDHFGLAKYLMDQVRRIPDAKKYKRSRNLIVPEPKDRIALGGKEVQPPRGASMIYRGAFIPGRPQYIRYILPVEKKSGGEPDPDRTDQGGAA